MACSPTINGLRSLVIEMNAKTTILLKFARMKTVKFQQCKYFEFGYCKFKESCKYDHTAEKIKVNGLLDGILKLEKQNVRFRETNEQQEYAICVINGRLSKAKIENTRLRKISKEHENKSDGITLVTDDLMESNTIYIYKAVCLSLHPLVIL